MWPSCARPSKRHAWVGLATVCGVAGRGETLDVDPAPADHRPAGLRILLRRPEGPRKTSPPWSPRYLVGEIDVDPFIYPHRIPLAEVNRGFELMEAQDGIRSVLQMV